MNEIKVLGASQKNVGAINRVLNSPVFTLTPGHISPDIKFKYEEEHAEIELPPTGICIPLSVSGQLMWFPISGFGLLTFKEEYSPEVSGMICNVDVAQTPISGEYVLTNYNPETSAYFEWVGVDDCDIECPDDVQTEQRWEEDLRRLIWI